MDSSALIVSSIKPARAPSGGVSPRGTLNDAIHGDVDKACACNLVVQAL